MSGWNKTTLIVGAIFLLLMMSGMPTFKSASIEAKPLEDTNIKALVNHAPIYINNDTDFDAQALSEGWPGSGTSSDPYIIEGYYISTSNNTVPIVIKNTTRYFAIRNCSVYKTNTSFADYGIYFYNITNGNIHNVTVSSDDSKWYVAAIMAEDVSYVEITNITTLNFTRYGVIASGETVNIYDSIIIDNNDFMYAGIYLINTYNSIIANNIIDAGFYGVYCRNSDVNILQNTIKADVYAPVYLYQTDASLGMKSGRVTSNRIEGGNYGIYSSLLNTVVYSNEIRNATEGIRYRALGYSRTYIQDNKIFETNTGISIWGSGYSNAITIKTNRIVNVTYVGMEIYGEGDNIYVAGNAMNKGGIYLHPSGDYTNMSILSTNTLNGRPIIFAKNSDMNGAYSPENAAQILGYNVKNFRIENLTISNATYGIELLNSYGNTIKNNIIANASYGVYLWKSRNNVITKNSVRGHYVCYLTYSANNFIYANEFFGDGYDDITYNYWYNVRGNYWYEWAQTHNDSDGDGIIDDPYPLYGSYNADPAPLARSPLIKAPSAPLLSIQSGDGKILLSWSAPENDGGSEILSYNIYRGTDVNNMVLLSSVDANITEYEDLSVENGQLYFYYVTALNYAGEGEKSNTVSSTPVGKPSEPQHLVYSVSNDTVTLQWSAPLDDGGVDIKEYRVYRNGVRILSLAGTQTWCVDENLEYGVSYTYWITAVNVAGESNASNTVEITLSSVPEAPANLSMEMVNKSLYLHWTPGDSRGSEIIEYRIYRNGTFIASTRSNITWIVMNGDFNGVYYVTAVNSVGESEPSASVYVMILQNESQNSSGEDNDSNNTDQGYTNKTVILVSGGNDLWLMIAVMLEIGIIGSIWYLIIGGKRETIRDIKEHEKESNESKIEHEDLNERLK